jgi:hypothetical protein
VVRNIHHCKHRQENAMTTTIGPGSTPMPAAAPAQPNDGAADASANAQGETHAAEHTSTEHPLAKFAPGELHRFVQAFAPAGAHTGAEAPTLLAPFQAPPQPGPLGPHAGPGIPLYDTQRPGAPAPQLAAPLKPAPPMELGQLETLNTAAQRYNISKAPKDEDLQRDLGTAKLHLKAATEALRAGDYQKAAGHMRALGLPLPLKHSGEQMSEASAVTAILLGAPVKEGKKNGWSLELGKKGFQPLNDLNGFAANAIMINRLSVLPGGVSNPPSEAQATQYMRDFANPAKGPKPTPQQIMQAASEITNGMIIHYSSAGQANPAFGANPNPHVVYKGTDGKTHEFNSVADAQKAIKANNPPLGQGETIHALNARSPDTWSDIASPGSRAGRHVGDCESKVFVQTRLLTAAGFTSLGSVNVEHGDSGHMFGVLKARDGTIWITSNEEFKQVMPAKADNGVVTQEHLDYTLRNMTAEVYGVQPNYKGEFDGIKIGAAATAKLKGADPAIDSIRRSTEMTMMGKTEALIPPPPPQAPAGK